MDYTATILEALGLADELSGDGRSYLPLLLGEKQEDRDMVFTQFNTTAMKGSYPMRCIQSQQYGYIFNAWSDGETFYKNESMSGLTYKAMKRAGEEDEELAERVRFFNYRCNEEFYDFKTDPDALHNLIHDPDQQERIKIYKERLKNYMKESNDPVYLQFAEYLEKQQS